MTTAIRIFSVSAISVCVLTIYTSYYMYMDKIYIAAGSMFAYYFVGLTSGAILGGLAGGSYGIWSGMAIAGLVSILICAVCIRLKYRNLSFPLLLDHSQDDNIIFLNTTVSQDNVMEIAEKMEKVLIQKAVELKPRTKVRMIIEEVGMLFVAEEQTDIRHLECCVWLEKDIRLQIRTDGEKIDLQKTDDKGQSPSKFLGYQIVNHFSDNRHLETLGWNRYEFCITYL